MVVSKYLLLIMMGFLWSFGVWIWGGMNGAGLCSEIVEVDMNLGGEVFEEMGQMLSTLRMGTGRILREVARVVEGGEAVRRVSDREVLDSNRQLRESIDRLRESLNRGDSVGGGLSNQEGLGGSVANSSQSSSASKEGGGEVRNDGYIVEFGRDLESRIFGGRDSEGREHGGVTDRATITGVIVAGVSYAISQSEMGTVGIDEISVTPLVSPSHSQSEDGYRLYKVLEKRGP